MHNQIILVHNMEAFILTVLVDFVSLLYGNKIVVTLFCSFFLISTSQELRPKGICVYRVTRVYVFPSISMSPPGWMN